MGLTEREKEWGAKASRFLKAELKRALLTYADLRERLKSHGLTEIEASIMVKLRRGTFAATFLTAALAALEMEDL